MLEGIRFPVGDAPYVVQLSTNFKMPKLLIIDDEPSVRRSLEMIASTDGWEVFSSDQFADFARLIRENAIEVLACDYRMPPVTGFDVLEKIRVAGLRLPTIIISACASSIDTRRAEELGVQEILRKPPDVSAVRLALRKALQQTPPAGGLKLF